MYPRMKQSKRHGARRANTLNTAQHYSAHTLSYYYNSRNSITRLMNGSRHEYTTQLLVMFEHTKSRT